MEYFPTSWTAGRTLPKTSSNLSDSDVESDKPGKNQSALFIHKLYEMATCNSHAHIFGFSEDGMSLKIRDAGNLGNVLERYFKHKNTSSFIRQLNNYGFKTISSVSSGNSVQTFAHPYFYRDGKDLLDTINRKTAKNVKKCKGDIIKELRDVEVEYRKRFSDMEKRNTVLERKNDMLVIENKKLRLMCHELEKNARFLPIAVEPLRLSQNTALAPLFENAINITEPLLEVNSTASDMSRSPYGEDLNDHPLQTQGEKNVVDEDILESLMQGESEWTDNEFTE